MAYTAPTQAEFEKLNIGSDGMILLQVATSSTIDTSKLNVGSDGMILLGYSGPSLISVPSRCILVGI